MHLKYTLNGFVQVSIRYIRMIHKLEGKLYHEILHAYMRLLSLKIIFHSYKILNCKSYLKKILFC